MKRQSNWCARALKPLMMTLTSLLFTSLVTTASIAADLKSQARQPQKDLQQLLNMNFEEMSEQDKARLNLLTGNASQDDIQAMGLLDDIAASIWGKWTKVNIPGAYCSDGSQYKIFVMKANSFWDWLLGYSSRLTVYFEPGGACWDYESCSGQAGVRGAANPNGIPDNHMNLADFLDPNKSGGSVNSVISPIILKNHPSGQNVETAYWNKVFVPYCTGDVYAGNKTVTYHDPSGQNQPLTYRHLGAKNMEKVINYLQKEFYRPREMMVSGCSAGGAGALINYHFIRQALNPRKSYLLNDSGPIYPAPGSGNHYPLHQTIRNVWNLDYLLGNLEYDLPGSNVAADYGRINTVLADNYPFDRFGLTLFKRDRNYSAYSYARFFGLDENDPVQQEQILQLWAQDIDRMTQQYNSRGNLHYYVPYLRNMNESHCTSIVEFTGTEYQAAGVDLSDFINQLLNRSTVNSYEEPDNPADANVSSVWIDLVNLLL